MPDSTPIPQEETRLTRRAWIGLSAAACGTALALGALPAQAIGYGDKRTLRFLEEIELLEAEFFLRTTLTVTIDGLEERESNAFALIARQDNDHALWCKLARRKFGVSAYENASSPNFVAPRPLTSYHFSGDTFSSRSGLYSTAIHIKETALGAYYGLIARAGDPKIIQALAALAGVEGRHLAMLKELSGQPSLAAFESSLSPTQASSRLRKYGLSSEAMR